MTFQFSDRYSATGTPYPDPETVCRGQCEGMGVVPVHVDEFDFSELHDPVWAGLWMDEHRATCNFRGVMRVLWRHKEWWYWRSVLRDVRQARRWQFCADGWHFVVCPTCNGTRVRGETE